MNDSNELFKFLTNIKVEAFRDVKKYGEKEKLSEVSKKILKIKINYYSEINDNLNNGEHHITGELMDLRHSKCDLERILNEE